MNGVNAKTGKALSGAEHLRQSIADILTTPVGSRVMRRDYGSLLPLLIDQPLNPATKLRLFAATAHAIAKWEPRFTLTKTRFGQADSGKFELHVEGIDESGQQVQTGVAL